MKRDNTQTLGDVVKGLLRKYGLEDGIKAHTLYSVWDNELGPMIAGRTQEIRLRGNVLYVKLSSSVLRQELHMQKQLLIKRLNDAMGEYLVEEIVLR